MKIRTFAIIGALVAAPPTVFAQANGNDGTAGSAGDGDRAQSYTRLLFSDLDKNRDGQIDKIEGAKLEPSLVKKMDTNADGKVSQAEFDQYQAATSGSKVPSSK
ncbi:EF-hand domain-containing protein [Uliginosibacterium sp. H3]|uniref:EF-hand domain-containing protein n=1 Tax=Uliginosibacterium silvisoli TaxID=3114758 RepID=A0ABU6K897_9RHOO|nr:EF-hand domain-containing protein [Uliginosibacterium sp. H3]